jgi:hypothetical protein
VNGAGKSSIGGAAFRAHGADYYNLDEVARQLIAAQPGLTGVEANAVAWRPACAGEAMPSQRMSFDSVTNGAA